MTTKRKRILVCIDRYGGFQGLKENILVVKIGSAYSFLFCLLVGFFQLFFFFKMERNIKINEEINNNSSNNQCSHRSVHRMRIVGWWVMSVNGHYYCISAKWNRLFIFFQKIENLHRSFTDFNSMARLRLYLSPSRFSPNDLNVNTGNNKPQHIQFTIYIIF